MSHRSPFRRVRLVAGCLVGLLTVAAAAGCSTRSSADQQSAGPAGPAGSGTAEVSDGAAVKLALVPGGAHAYFTPWKPALDRAAADFKLGDTVFDETAQWDQAKQNNLLNSLLARGYNAFGVFGASPSDINTTFADVKSQGAAVASLGSCPSGTQNGADFCLSTDVETAAYKAAKAAIDAMGGRGALVHLTGLNVDSNTQRRIAGVSRAVDEAGGAVTLAQTVTDIDSDIQTAQKAVADLLASRGSQIDGIVTTAYNPAVAIAEAMTANPRDIAVIALDDAPQVFDAVRSGAIDATVVQNAVGQAYIGAYVLTLLESGQCSMAQPGATVDSGSFVVTKDDVDTVQAQLDAKNEELKAYFAANLLSCK